MNTLRVGTLCGFLLVGSASYVVAQPNDRYSGSYESARYVSGNAITGELVITNAARNQFRIVDHSGIYTAPAGVSVTDFDGKPVQVEFGRDGRVVSLTQMPVHVEPVVDGFQLVTGELVLRDPVQRTFTIAGDNRTYIAPSAIDLRPYDHRPVKVRLDLDGNVTAVDLSDTAMMPSRVYLSCGYDGNQYMAGTALCRDGMQYRCEDGSWRGLGISCSPSPASTACEVENRRYASGSKYCNGGSQYICESGAWRNLGDSCTEERVMDTRPIRTCLVGGASVADGSSICRRGTTFQCIDGTWINAGRACS